jgi:hypothetical protein
MAHTTQDLATEVMRLPGWIDATETPDAEDAAHIVRIYTDFYAEWTLRKIAYWPLTTIPDEVFQHVVRVIADAVTPSFGDDPMFEIDPESGVQVSMGVRGWKGLKRVTQRDESGLPTMGTFF